jgi:hypothetical protein
MWEIDDILANICKLLQSYVRHSKLMVPEFSQNISDTYIKVLFVCCISGPCLPLNVHFHRNSEKYRFAYASGMSSFYFGFSKWTSQVSRQIFSELLLLLKCWAPTIVVGHIDMTNAWSTNPLDIGSAKFQWPNNIKMVAPMSRYTFINMFSNKKTSYYQTWSVPTRTEQLK